MRPQTPQPNSGRQRDSTRRATAATARLIDAAEIVALATVYVIVARIGLTMDAVAGFATLVWPPTGIALAALLLRGYRLWPGVTIGAFVANALTGAPIPVALGMAAGNTLEALLGASALRRIPGFHVALDRVRDVVGLVVLAAMASTAVSATIGVTSLYLGGVVSRVQVGETWRAWWLGDLIGALLVAPVLLIWASTPHRPPTGRRLVEAAALGASVVGVGLFVFGGVGGTHAGTFRQAYLVFPPLIWAALRFGPRGAASTALLVSLVALWGTAMGHGPFARPALYQSLFALQVFMAVAATTFLILGAAASERRQALRDLQAALTEQERLLAERDTAHQRLITVLEQSPVAIGVAEAPSGRFEFVNDEVKRLLGRRPTRSKAVDPEGGGWEGFHTDGRKIAPDEWPLARAMWDGEVVRNQIVRVVRAHGGVLDIAINAAPVRDRDGSIIAGVVIFWDVTAQRRAEEELRLAHETVAAANRAKAEFFAVMSHELRTPLTAIAGYVEVMALGIQGPLTAEQRDSLVRIQHNQRHLLSLIDDVLIFAKLESDRLSVELRPVPVREAVEGLEPLVAPDVRRKHLTFACGACDSSLSVQADPEKLRQILLNLVANAIKFTPSGGRVDVDAGRDGDAIRIRVRDTGIGIPADQLARVFEPFFQVEHGPTRRFPGVGLGLSIARDLSRAMRGDVWLESRPGEGTTVTLSLPAA